LFALLLLLGGCGRDVPPPEPLRPVLTRALAASAGSRVVTYAGEVRSRYESTLGFRISGKIVARLVDVGAQVQAGDVLARLDPADTSLSQVAAEAQLNLAEADVHRYRELRARNFVSQAALDAKETTFKAARAQADLARNQDSYTVLRADHAGIVSQVVAETGQVVAAGQAVVRLARADALEVAIAVPESRVAGARVGQAAVIGLWADEQASFRGVLRELSQVADPLTRTYAARVSFAESDSRVRLGMTANVALADEGATTSPTGSLSVPLGAVFQQDGKPAVWVVGGDQTLTLRQVTVTSYGETDAVLDGIKTGERIVIAGVHKLSAGEKILAVDQPETAPNASAR
jgi:RND family efflux transporter MFP subunit